MLSYVLKIIVSIIPFLLLSGELLQRGNVCGQPTLQPLDFHVCPNDDNVTYTCIGTHVNIILWSVEPYFTGNDAIVFGAGQLHTTGMEQQSPSRQFFASVIEYNITSDHVADITTSLTVVTRRIENETNITCQTTVGTREYSSSTTLYIAGVPYWKHENITYLLQETYFTAVLQLGDMFGGGGVPIDYYIIEVNNDIELATTDPTYSINISYFIILLVNISAHNCAGYSDLIMLEVQYTQGMDYETVGLRVSTILAIAIGIATIICTIIALLLLSLRRCTKARRNGSHDDDPVVNCGVVGNPAYETHRCGTHYPPHEDRLEQAYNMEDNPIYTMTSTNTSDRQLKKTETRHEYETVDKAL